MGDRASIVLKDWREQVVLYTHWDGTEAPEVVRAATKFALEMKRHTDLPYFARIIFCRMVPPASWYDELGYGIMSEPTGDSRVIEIDVEKGLISSDDFDIPLQTLADFITGPDEIDENDGETDGDMD